MSRAVLGNVSQLVTVITAYMFLRTVARKMSD